MISGPTYKKKHKHSVLYALSFFLFVTLFVLSQFVIHNINIKKQSLSNFSKENTMLHLAEISQSARYPGSVQHKDAQNYIIQEIQKLGLSPEIHTSNIPESDDILENILVKIEGTSHDNAILIMAHYDTELNTPGAGDNGSGTAIVLELLRTLAEMKTPQNDLIILFSDAEEMGMLGAQAFVDNHPWISEVRIAINFDTITIGPAFMWQTSPENGWLVNQYISTVSQPMANSWLHSLSMLLPLDTDLSPFIDADIAAYNFSTSYLYPEIQTAQDTIAIIHPNSIEHAGIQGELLIRHLANIDLLQTKEQDQVFFNLWGPIMIHYPESLAIPFALVAAIICMIGLASGLQKKYLDFREIIKGFSIFLLALISVVLLAIILWLIGLWIKPAAFAGWIFDPRHSQNDWLFFISLLILTSGSSGLIYQSYIKEKSSNSFFAGIIFFWLFLIGLSSFFLPEVSYLFVWPMIAALLFSIFRVYQHTNGTFKSFYKPVGMLLFLIPMLIWIPFLVLFFMVTGMGAFPILVLFMGIFPGIMFPFYDTTLFNQKKLFSLGFIAFGLLLFIAGIWVA